MQTFAQKLKNVLIGQPKNIHDRTLFHKLSLVAFFAWIGLGADGLSSSCYGPQEAFLALGSHPYLAIFVALSIVFTIFVIATSYSHIVELFPSGGGGYIVASKLLSPKAGMISGCALLIDYVLTISVSIASGSDAIFSLLPINWHVYRIYFVVLVVILMTVLNMRGVKESIMPLVPIFLIFLFTHIFVILYALSTHLPNVSQIAVATRTDVINTSAEVGFFGMIFLILKAYTMGAGTYTGLEAVSNGIPVLREPRVETAKRTMHYMAFSLSFIVLGLMLGYIFYNVSHQPGKTLNAVFLEQATASWGINIAYIFIFITLISEAALLFIAAQTGFIDGPRVLANMSVDKWFPTRFSMLSERFVIQNGILIMSGLAFLIMLLTRGSVRFLVVLYSINVFITFVLSQAGMVRHWWNSRAVVKGWLRKISINSIGLVLCTFILCSMIIFKFKQGGWITLLFTGSLVLLAIFIKRHYHHTIKLMDRLNSLVEDAESSTMGEISKSKLDAKGAIKFDSKGKTAVLLVNGYNGMGLHTLFGIIRLFGGVFKNFIFIQIGAVDAGTFKSPEEIDSLKSKIQKELNSYIKFMNKHGHYALGFSSIGVDVVEEVEKIAHKIIKNYGNVVFFGGQLVFPKDSVILRFLHNYTVFALQKRLYRQGIPFVILPIRVG